MTEQLQFDFSKVQGNHNTAYVPMNDLENLAKTILNLRSTIDTLKDSLDASIDELKDVDKIMPLVDKLIHTKVKFNFEDTDWTPEDMKKLSEGVKDYMLDKYGVQYEKFMDKYFRQYSCRNWAYTVF